MTVIHQQDARISMKVGVVVSRFNQEVTLALLDGALRRLRELEVPDSHVQVVWVPGAVEIPFAAKCLAKTGVDAVVCLGAVIRGETDHFTYVCQQVSYGCQRVALDCDLPVIFGVLTTDNEFQAQDRVGGNYGHKGIESVDAAMEMVAVRRSLDGLK